MLVSPKCMASTLTLSQPTRYYSDTLFISGLLSIPRTIICLPFSAKFGQIHCLHIGIIWTLARRPLHVNIRLLHLMRQELGQLHAVLKNLLNQSKQDQ
jgi:hypothetical protein